MDHFYDPNKKIHKPMFDVIEPSIVRAHYSSKRDVSFSSYLHQSNNQQKKFVMPQTGQNRTEDSDQISIFDAAKYLSSGLYDGQKEQPLKGVKVNNYLSPIPPRLSSVSSSIDDNGSNYGGSSTCPSNNYRARSFHATPTASSEASWNSQTGLLANPPGSIGVSITKTLSPNSSTTSNVTTPRWPRISAKWLIPRRKCPCSGKKSVQVEEKIEPTAPRMVDLRRSTSSNGSATNYISSWHSPRQNNPKNLGTTLPLASTTPNVVTPQQEPRNNSNFNHSVKIPNVTNHVHSIPKAAGPLKPYANHSEITGTTATTVTVAATATTTSSTPSSNNGFTFPILENSPLGVKKMFTVISDPPRDSLEVFQPRSHPSPTSRRTSYDDDNVLSDGSSDLFEIDSFSTTYNPCRDSLDDEVVIPASSFNSTTMKRLEIVCRSNNNNVNNVDDNDGMHEPITPSVAHTECYAPSEVSIDWSVTTAEGFDRASLTNFSVSASEVGQYAAMRRESERNNGDGGGGGGRREEKRGSSRQSSGKGNGGNGGGGLFSCRCEKAVSVGPGPIKCSAEGGPPIAARHVSGRPTQQPHHGVATHVNGRWK